MPCPRCQHENRPQAKFCEECASPLNVASSTARSYADLKSEVESLRRALTEALEQQTATRVERRGFIVGTLGLLAAPLAVEAQQVGRSTGSASSALASR